ncbi:MAG: DUF211 domain-containing protein [Promethearchaeota archaeon]
MNSCVRRLVLDVMKPHEPDIIVYANHLAMVEQEKGEVTAVNIAVIEVDRLVENIKITIQGNKLDYELISNKIKELGGAIHSIDLVIAGKSIIEETPTPQD